MDNSIEKLMSAGMEQLRDMVDVNTVVGDMVISDNGTVVLPVSRISMGFVSGGAQYNLTPVKRAGSQLDGSEEYPLAGCTAAGISLAPMGFLCITDDGVQVMPLDYDSTADRLAQLIPTALDMLLKAANGFTCKAPDNGGSTEK